ncbi:MAG: hypothetical protein QXG86_02060 [Candidatus Woesearchaeota archaeon]
MTYEISRRDFVIKTGGSIALLLATSAADLFINKNLNKNTNIKNRKSLEHLIEKTFPAFILSSYIKFIEPTEQNLKNYNLLFYKLKIEEQELIEEGLIDCSLDSSNDYVSHSLEKLGYTHNRIKLEDGLDSYILGKTKFKEEENKVKIFLYWPIVPTFGEYRGFKNLASRVMDKVFVNLEEAHESVNYIVNHKLYYQTPVENIMCEKICNQFYWNKKKILAEILRTVKVHEIKGHVETYINNISDEERAIIIELLNANSMYPFFRLWRMAHGSNVDSTHRVAANTILEEIYNYKNAKGQNYSGIVIANSDLKDLKEIAKKIFYERFI